MKPRTILQKEVAGIMHKVNGLSREQLEWAKKKCFTPKAYACRGVAWCSECGEEFECTKDDEGKVVCPHCGARCEVMARTRRKEFSEENGFNIVTTCEGWQVVRAVDICKVARRGARASYNFCDICQNWIHRTGADVVVSKKIVGMGWNRRYSWHSDSEIRQGSAFDNMYVRVINYKLVYPRMSILPDLKLRGYDKQKCKSWPFFDTFVALLKRPHAETLLKAGQKSAFEYGLVSKYSVDRWWAQIKVCIRHGYMIEDFSIWKDYVEFLEEMGKDTHNPHYLCPKDLKAAHDVYMRKVHKKRKEERKKEEAKRVAESEDNYIKMKSMFFGIMIKVDDIEIDVLKSVKDVYDEGEAMHHCVYTNGYYEKEDSVLLSARRKGERVETVEFSLDKMKVVQSRGLCNENTEFHDIIVNAVNSNAYLFNRARVS